jgi:hypothetical protein
MNKFKDAAIQVLRKANAALPSKEITRLAIESGILGSAGKTPERTMNAQLNSEVKRKGTMSRFIKVRRSWFSLNPEIVI